MSRDDQIDEPRRRLATSRWSRRRWFGWLGGGLAAISCGSRHQGSSTVRSQASLLATRELQPGDPVILDGRLVGVAYRRYGRGCEFAMCATDPFTIEDACGACVCRRAPI